MLDIAYHVLLQSSGLWTVYHVNESISLRKVVHENAFNMIWFTNSWAVHNQYTTLNYRKRINKLCNSKKPKKCNIPVRKINLKQILNLKKVQEIFKLHCWRPKGKRKEKVTKCPLKPKCGKSPGTNALKNYLNLQCTVAKLLEF